MGSFNWDEIQKRKKEYIIKEGRTLLESGVHCPHCGEENENDEGQFSDDKDYDKWVKHDCAHCLTPFESLWEAAYSTRKVGQE